MRDLFNESNSYEELVRYAYSLTQNEACAKDLVHDVFLEVYMYDDIKLIKDTKAYIKRCIKNSFFRTYKKSKNTPYSVFETFYSIFYDPTITTKKDYFQLYSSLQTEAVLTEEEELLLEYYFQGFSEIEISKLINVRKKDVRKIKQRVKRRFRKLC